MSSARAAALVVAAIATVAMGLREASVAAAAPRAPSRRGPARSGEPAGRRLPLARRSPNAAAPAPALAAAPLPAPRARAASLAAPAEGDFLRGNGLGSPFCGRLGALGAQARANCEGSGFAPAPAPTGDYAFDVHIDTGAFAWQNDSDALVQDSLEWAWMALVVGVRALLVMLEWCYSLDLLGGGLLATVHGALAGAAAALTAPGLGIVLAIAAALAAWHGLVRRRVAQTLGEAALMVAMMVAGLVVIADPGGTVGAGARWVDQASLGTLGAAAGGPGHPRRTLTADLAQLYAVEVTGPWCYLEFADVRWCEQPSLLDARLRRAALAIAREDRALVGGEEPASARRAALLAMAWRLEAARTNGALFLALPANGPARNSINERSSLLSALCGGSTDATSCTGPTAAQAEARTQYGTTRRVLGLALIWVGALFMLALVGWIALQLLRAAILALLYLLVAPAAVLAPALGDGGRAAFRAWGGHLLGALVAKLVYSLLLGVVLLVLGALAALSELGWWVQWFLTSALWWIVFRHRHELLALVRFGDVAPLARTPGGGGFDLRRVLAYSMASGLPRWLRGSGERLRRPTPGPLRDPRRPQPRPQPPAPPEPPRPFGRGPGGPGPTVPWRSAPGAVRSDPTRSAAAGSAVRANDGSSGLVGDDQVATALALERAHALARMRQARTIQERLSAKRARLLDVERAERQAAEAQSAEPDSGAPTARASVRRELRLRARAARLRGEIESERAALTDARATVRERAPAMRRERGETGGERGRAIARLYDEQAALPARGMRGANGARRDYRRLAALAGVGAEEWDGLAGAARMRAVLAIDGELARRAARERARRRAVPGRDGLATGHERSGLDRDRESPGSGRAPRRPAPAGRVQGPRSRLFEGFLAESRAQGADGKPPLSLADRARAGGGGAAGPERAEERRARLRRQLGAAERGWRGT